jgi:WD40 repeat protein/serine/threonine protein kinase
MTIATVSDLVEVLRDSQLLDSVQWEELTLDLPKAEDAGTLAQWLVQRGWLTAYQVERLLRHNGQGLTLGPYRLLEPLGEGARGQVFKALHRRLQRIVALRVIHQERLAQDPDAVRRFHHEAQAAAQLSHPNIALIYDADQVGDTHFIAMEYVEGTDLAKLVQQSGALPIAVASDYIRQATLGLQHAFEFGLVHRDIKPSNLLVTTVKPPKGKSSFYRRPSPTGSATAKNDTAPAVRPASPTPGAIVKILDLGLACGLAPTDRPEAQASLTEAGGLLGTPDFIAPERARDARNGDIRADLYSLGCTFYFLLTGQPPFPHGSTREKLLRHQLDQPPPVDQLRRQVPPDLALIVGKLMAKEAGRRYQTPKEVTAALDALARSANASREAEPVPALRQNQASSATMPVDSWPTIPSGERASEAPASPRPAVAAPPEVGTSPLEGLEVLKGHKGSVISLAFAVDGRLLASGGLDGQVRLWDLTGAQPREYASLEGHPSDVSALAFAPGETRLLASASGSLDGTVFLWDLAASQPQGRALLRGHHSPVNALTFAPDGKTLALGCNDKSVRLWDVSRGEPREQSGFRGHSSYVMAVAFAPDGKTVASGCEDGVVRLWKRGWLWSSTVAVLPVHLGPVHSVAFAPDGRTLATGSMDRTVWLGDLSGGKPRDRALLEGHLDMVRLVAFTPGGEALFSVGSGVRAILWDLATGAKLREWQLYRTLVTSVALSQDGRCLALGNNDGTVSLFRLNLPKTTA